MKCAYENCRDSATKGDYCPSHDRRMAGLRAVALRIHLDQATYGGITESDSGVPSAAWGFVAGLLLAAVVVLALTGGRL